MFNMVPKSIELESKINKVIANCRNNGIFSRLEITSEINKQLNLELTVSQGTEHIKTYREELVYNMLDNYKDNVINAMEMYVNILQRAFANDNLKLAKETIDSIIKLQQLDKFDIYEKFGIDTNATKINKTDKVRQAQIVKLLQRKPNLMGHQTR